MTMPKDFTADRPWLDTSRWAILVGYRGSIAHGTYTPSSDPDSIDDKDVMSFCVPPEDRYLGLAQFGSRGTKEDVEGEWDVVTYEARKAIGLLLKGNPNVMSMLWLDEKHVISATQAGHLLRDNRDLFVGKHVHAAYCGYARAQAAKMTRGEHKGYMGAKRRELVDRYGYDCKSASHLIRLLRQGTEFLTTGELQVERHDAAELVAIKKGEWTLERVHREAERLFELADLAFVRSSLPNRPDWAKVNELCVNVAKLGMARDLSASYARQPGEG